MDIFGAIFFIILPFIAGYSCKSILRWKETNQIETYLIGFFFLFFLQGVVFVPSVWLGLSLSSVCNMMWILLAVLVLLAMLFGGCRLFLSKKKEPVEKKMKVPWKKTEKFCFICMLMVFLLILLRMVQGMNYIREDVMLETVQVTLQSDGLFVNHPLTGRIMETGMITSKKIVTLPLFYACVSQMTGIEPRTLLYILIQMVVLLGSYYAMILLFSKVATVNRGKMYVFWSVYGLLILSGDYHTDTLAHHLIQRGYDGETICFSVIMPYLLYLIVSWYKKESEEDKITWGVRITYLLKGMLGLVVSVVITGLGTGFVFLFLAMVLAGTCCLLKSIKEVRACKES